MVRDYLLDVARRHSFEVVLGPRMAHFKAILIDEEALVLGSSNFDFVSYHCEEELVGICRDRDVIRAFIREVIVKARSEALPQTSWRPPKLAVAWARFGRPSAPQYSIARLMAA
jgi:phosphatidylserine/phosphatidylglycerophosphate/cardiolipin synthase-like enzyme